MRRAVLLIVTVGWIALLAACDEVFPYVMPPASATPTPQSSTALPLAELKYRLIQNFGGMGVDTGIHFCDPDFYPLGRPGYEQQQALKLYPTIAQDSAQFQVILRHLGFSPTAHFSPDQQLAIYREYKKLNALTLQSVPGGYSFQFAYRDSSGAFQVQGTISPQGTITMQKKGTAREMAFSCPICLIGTTQIDTPSGPMAVKDLQQGMFVWTLDQAGRRVAMPIVKTAQITVGPGHSVVHLQLNDGRELFVSPGHPTADGRPIGSLMVGDEIDGGIVIGSQITTFTDLTTYDILPSGDTGFYWANGILLGSTLTPHGSVASGS